VLKLTIEKNLNISLAARQTESSSFYMAHCCGTLKNGAPAMFSANSAVIGSIKILQRNTLG
jgi:hypothetical protein